MEQTKNFELSKSSSNSELKRYFSVVFKLHEADEPFPVNLDEVWMLVYSDRNKAMASLRSNFIEGVDFNLYQMGKVVDSSMLRNGIRIEAKLTVSCMEYFVARKVRPVFEVYRMVLHSVNKRKQLSDHLSSRNINARISWAKRVSMFLNLTYFNIIKAQNICRYEVNSLSLQCSKLQVVQLPPIEDRCFLYLHISD